MADNVAITPGVGATVAADDIGGILYQRIKLGLGADGTAVDAVAGAGAVSTGVQRVTLASDDPAVALLGGTGKLKDNGPGWTSVHGVLGIPKTSADATTPVAVTDAPTGGQKLVITDLIISSDTALNVTLIEETSSTVICGPFYLAAGSTVQVTPRSKAWKLPVADKKLLVDASVAGNIMVDAHYYSEA